MGYEAQKSLMNPARTLVMACATVIEEMLPLPEGMSYQVFDFGLHINPDKLRHTLQDAIDAVDGSYETIILGYGQCSKAIIGIRAAHCTLVVPKVDDCIAIFLGSRAAYRREAQIEPGTYYWTKGWIEVGDSPFQEYDSMVQRYGVERAKRLMHAMLRNYKRLVLINTGQYELDRYREFTRKTAERFGLRYEEVQGSNALIKKMLEGVWDDDFLVLPPGEMIRQEHFWG
jgi:hypothetical protein